MTQFEEISGRRAVRSRGVKRLYIMASRFDNATGGLIWTNELAEYARSAYRGTEIIDISKQSEWLGKNKFVGMFYFLVYFFFQTRHFIFTDHRLHLRINLALLFDHFVSGNPYATLCHHVFYKTKKNIMRRNIEYLSEKIFLRNAEFVIVPSRSTADEVAKFGVPRNKVLVINPTHTFMSKNLPERGCDNRLLFVGNLEERKGVDLLLQALPHIHEAKFTLDIVGGAKSEEYMNFLEDMIKDLNLSDKVNFHGRVFEEEIPGFYRRANIFVFPSRYEGYGIVLLEAMSFGLPIVATAIPTTIDVVREGVNGYLCPVEDSQCLADRLTRLLDNPKIRERIGANNFRESRKFRSWQTVANETFDTFRSYLDNI